MAEFSISNRKTGGHEGGWADDPDDGGGETWHGISRVNFENFPGWAIIDRRKAESDFPACLESDPELLALAVKFYHDTFWIPLNGDAIPEQALADRLYDIAVNSGAGTAVSFLQGSLNILNRNQQLYKDIKADGKMGQGTLGALTECLSKRGLDLLLKDLIFEQACNYRRIMLEKPSQEKFLTSWYGRLEITINK